MAEKIAVAAETRKERGKNAARRLRASGKIPAVAYSNGSEALSLTVDPHQIQQVLNSSKGHNTLFDLKVEGKSTGQAMLRDWACEPLWGKLLHVDILRVAVGTKLKVKVPVHLEGEPRGVKLDGGILDFVMREVEVECLPIDIPEEMRIDVSELGLRDGIRAGDFPFASEVKLITDPDHVIVHVMAPRVEEEVAPTEEAEAAEGASEPELIRKPKTVEEGGNEGDTGTKE